MEFPYWRHGHCVSGGCGWNSLRRQRRWQFLRGGCGFRQGEMEVWGSQPGAIVGRGIEWNGLFRGLRRKLLCGGCGNREIEMEVSNGRRTAVRGEASARGAAGNGDDARSV